MSLLPGEIPVKYGDGGWIFERDKQRAELTERHPGWHIIPLLRLGLPTLWTAYRWPHLQCRSAGDMEELMRRVDEGRYDGPQQPDQEARPEIAAHDMTGPRSVFELDADKNALGARYPGWRVWFYPMREDRPVWEAHRMPLISRESPGVLSNALAAWESGALLDGWTSGSCGLAAQEPGRGDRPGRADLDTP